MSLYILFILAMSIHHSWELTLKIEGGLEMGDQIKSLLEKLSSLFDKIINQNQTIIKIEDELPSEKQILWQKKLAQIHENQHRIKNEMQNNINV
ncbi:unnamed protein product, partial [Iphiclides podalirius]